MLATGSTVTVIGTFQDVLDDGQGEPVLSLLDISYEIPETVSGSPTCTVGHKVIRWVFILPLLHLITV